MLHLHTSIAALEVEQAFDGELTTLPSRPKTYPAVTPYAKIQLAASKRAAAAARVQQKASVHDMYMHTYSQTCTHTSLNAYMHACIHTYIYKQIYVYLLSICRSYCLAFGFVFTTQ
jgi:hypothetical protein